MSQTLGLAKLAGVSGLQILRAQPALTIAIPTTGDVLALPMKSVEIMWNSYGNLVIQKFFGIPVILNMTQTFKTGPGYTLKEIRVYIPLNNTSLLKSIKNKLIKWWLS